MELQNSKFGLFCKCILKDMAKEKFSINKKQVDTDLWGINRETRWAYFRWAVKQQLLTRIKGQENEFLINDNFQKILKSNVERIMEKCREMEELD